MCLCKQIPHILLIHKADAQSIHVLSVRLTVRPHFSKSRHTTQISSKNSDRYLRDCGSGRVDHWWHTSLVDPRPSTNQSTSLKSGSLFLVMVSVRLYVHDAPIKKSNHFSSWCFGWCLCLSHRTTQGLLSLNSEPFLIDHDTSVGYFLPEEPAEPKFAATESNVTAQIDGTVYLNCPIVSSAGDNRAVSYPTVSILLIY